MNKYPNLVFSLYLRRSAEPQVNYKTAIKYLERQHIKVVWTKQVLTSNMRGNASAKI